MWLQFFPFKLDKLVGHQTFSPVGFAVPRFKSRICGHILNQRLSFWVQLVKDKLRMRKDYEQEAGRGEYWKPFNRYCMGYQMFSIPLKVWIFYRCYMPCSMGPHCFLCFFRPGQWGRYGPWSALLPEIVCRSNGRCLWRICVSTTGLPEASVPCFFPVWFRHHPECMKIHSFWIKIPIF